MRVAFGTGVASRYEFRKLALASDESIGRRRGISLVSASSLFQRRCCRERDFSQFGANLVPEPHAKHLTQPHQDAKRSRKNRQFCGKLNVLVRPGEVPSLTLNQRVPGAS